MLCYAQSEKERLYDVRLNHALIQLYRNGNDCIGENADKTLDIAKGSTIYIRGSLSSHDEDEGDEHLYQKVFNQFGDSVMNSHV